eukprot:CAMPEP_0205807974 /NCGR_PEP_ID=MMETSP0205-20121125/11808_1 /ASSEMBLY_ACC=CAM_ASM_000278 /TAXON_ID=36767 /ORGANISM="Euplotes focardii, Strain TN1" /LENGTH=99 /DNA_ID=CAMNT_0053082949 /DNA_START=387 /DNA_END=682 /DNA_ORIENTATION=+
MMKYKPAPIYILDEIDAALDLENTQRIGEMIKKHFKDSQFIIVSLKEQMTFNAKTIFRVSNADGKSKVEQMTFNAKTIFRVSNADGKSKVEQMTFNAKT